MSRAKIDMTGWKMWEHGVPDSKVIVIEESPIRSADGHVQWKCQCTLCENYFIAMGKALRNGNTKSDGCYQKIRASLSNRKDLTGQRFGRLTVLNMLPERRNNKIVYHCKCDCGNECDVLASTLKNGNSKSCGCLRSENNTKRSGYNLTNQKFGKLTALYRVPNSSQKGISWFCQCDCGRTSIVRTEFLISGHVQSCGCIKYSIGEKNIEQILQDNNIQFIRDKIYFKDLLGDCGVPLRYDFIILENDSPIRLIEFDGPQHTKPSDYFGGEEAFKKLQCNDNLKNEYARAHHIPLVRIPYKERDHITLDLIMGDKYLVS